MAIRRPLIAFASLVALGVAAHGAFWWIVAGELGDGISAWVEQRRGEGWVISHAPPAIGGYPMRVRATIADPDIAGPGDPARWRWRGTSVAIMLQPWKPREIWFSFAGRHRLRIHRGARQENFESRAGSADGRAQLASDGRLDSIQLDLGAVEVELADQPKRLRLGRLRLTLQVPRGAGPVPGESGAAATKPDDVEPEGPVVSLSADQVMLPDGVRYPLGRGVGKIAIEAKLLGDPVVGPNLADTLASWRDAGGTLEIRRLEIVWGAFELSGEGSLALDRALQPIAAMTARISGYRETVDALVETGYVKGRDAMVAKLMLAIVARATPGGNSKLTVPVTVQNGILSAGPARLLVVPTIDWSRIGGTAIDAPNGGATTQAR